MSDEEGGWQPPPTEEPAEPRARRWPAVLLALALLCGLGLLLWSQVDQRVQGEMALLEADVRATHNLAEQAARRGDDELFTTLLSGRSPEWTAAQRDLLQEQLLFGNAGRALGLEPLPDSGSVTDVELSPDLREALLTVRHTYGQERDGARSTFHLQQTVSYRMGARGWLLAPPDETFWGPWQTREGRHLTLRYRQRDAAVAIRLLAYLDKTVADACQTWESACPPASSLRVSLEPGAQSLLEAREIPLSAGTLTLPSPSLVGLPPQAEGRRDVAERALFRGYAAPVVAAVNAELLAFDCCRQRYFFAALQRQTLHALGLADEPVAAYEYVQFVDSIISLPRLNQLWWWPQREPPLELEKQQIAAFVDFLLQETGGDVRHLQKGVTEAYGFWAWLREYTPYDPAVEQAQLTAAWHSHVIERANVAQEAAGRPPPPDAQQALWLTCQDDNGQSGLFRFDGPGERLVEITGDLLRHQSLLPAPGDEGILLFDRNPDVTSRLPPRLHNGVDAVPLSGDLQPAYSLPRDPQGRYLTVWRVSQSGRTIDGSGLLDTMACSERSDCALHAAPGLPFWSPAGGQLLFWETTQNELYLGNRDTLTPNERVAQGASWPFWLDEKTYGYVADEGRRIYVVEGEQEARPLLGADELLPVLQGRASDRNWQFASIIPAGDDALVGAVTLPGSSAHHFFLLDGARSGQRTLKELLYVPQLVVASPDSTISPDGRWLSLHLYPHAGLEIRFILHDIRANETVLDVQSPYFTAFHAHDWSADGRWLARLGNGYIELLAPAPGEDRSLYRRFVPTGGMQCSSLAWVDG
ncbi:MAG: hypothetical protein ACOCXI_12685 [Chloroflexota bacterium]